MPWTLYFFDRAIEQTLDSKRALPDTIFAGACLSLMVYMGGIYPLPQTVFVLALYGALYGVTRRDLRPLLCVVATGMAAFVLSAPKLVPMIELFARFPRLTDSPEWMDLTVFLAILTSRDQDFISRPVATTHWGWHEWGMYVGYVPVALMAVSLLWGRGQRLGALRWTAIILIVLGFGSFNPYAPWSLLHKVTVFRSQHVPSRWLYPALLASLAVAALVIERAMVLARGYRPLVELAAIVAVLPIARDVADVARIPLAHIFSKPPPTALDSMQPFHQGFHLPPAIGYPTGGEWAPSSLPAVIANVGTTDCSTFAGFHNWYRDQNNHVVGLGARGPGEPGYRGDAFIVEGVGHAEFARWSPNEVVVRVTGARKGDHVALDQNYDPGWLVNGRPALAVSDVPAATLQSSDETVVFRYRPKTLWLGLAIFVLGLPLLVGAARPDAARWVVRRTLRARFPERPARRLRPTSGAPKSPER
jgi:hypothetical protein